MKTSTNNNLRIGFGLSILLLVISSVFSYLCIQQLLDSARQVKHTNEVRTTLENVMSFLKDAETGQRGFLLTGDETFLDPYKGAYQKALGNLDKAISLTGDNALQQTNGGVLRKTLIQRGSRLQALIDLKKNARPIDYTDMKQGKVYMDSVRAQVNRMMAEENRLLQLRTQTQQKFAFFTPIVIIIAALLAILVSSVFYLRILKDVRERIRLQKELEDKDAEMTRRIDVIQGLAGRIAEGDYDTRIDDKQRDTLGSLSVALNRMAESLSFSFSKLSDNEWLQSGLARLNEKMVGEKDLTVLSYQIIEYVTAYTGSHVGALYLLEDDNLMLTSGYSLLETTRRQIPVGQGVVGQALLNESEIILEDVDPEYVTVSHATGNIRPRSVIAFPIFNESLPIGVLELAAIRLYTDRDLAFIKSVAQNAGTAIAGAANHKKLQELLEETQAQSEELQAQHSELENMNAELEAHTQKLQTSEEELKVQQEELQQSNFELEQRNHIISERNTEIQKKAEELELSTRYKSEFMANMSHELRTPLNSILLLSRYLSENNEQNLNEDQKESARVIFNSGSGLLDLIDELLDLSKIEAGKMDVDYAPLPLSELADGLNGLFQPIAKEKQITFRIDNDLKDQTMIETDRMKLEQILKNLLSNALKFTTTGHVLLRLRHSPVDPGMLQFIVEDTGVGIACDKLDIVFEAFTQADGSTKRKYGGTGLGLSISRQLARLMGGEVTVASEVGKGSAFTLTLPITHPAKNIRHESMLPPLLAESSPIEVSVKKARHLAAVIPDEIDDDRHNLQPGDKTILIIEDDTAFAGALLQFTRKQRYKGVVAVRGDQGLQMAREYKPQAILLDIQLPVMDGWEVMDGLKSDPGTRHIPVHIMSSLEAKRESRMHGAVDFINKPVALEQMQQIFSKLEEALTRSPKQVLIVEENAKHAQALSLFLESYQVSSSIQHSVAGSISILQDQKVDCVILDMGLPDRNAYDTLETVKTTEGMEDVPIIIFTGKNLSPAEESRIRQYADSIVVKTAHSYKRILDEVALFLHLVEEKKQDEHRPGYLADARAHLLEGKTVLIADDDVRNIFSLTKALEKHHIHVVTATDGAEALLQLEQHPETDIVLMDMMMPQMDGYESTTKIRQHPVFKHMPVIAVTAKAMLGDREKCIAAGASDYISKPVDIDQLISLLRVWLYDKQGNV
ncbi:response regulator [Taibaiella koreensis]|uniref:response regulator n=1 Tax=Taibaiella koreensis TaxID=1268548 RepID=UPI000E59B7AE|nr:response regulator [Taibaiella koreensis]